MSNSTDTEYDLLKELSAWKARFPQYEYRKQDECVALRLVAPVVAEPVGWIDQFGNLFHLGAWVPSRATYHDSYKTPWQPVYRAAPVGAAAPSDGAMRGDE